MMDSPIADETMKKDKDDRQLELSPESVNNGDPDDENEMEIQCGVGGWRPLWLQKFAKAEVYAIAHAMLGFIISADASYFVGTLSTVEKYFKLPSRISGFMQSSFEMASLVAMFVMGYLARHQSPMRLVSSGTALTAFACLCFAFAHFIFGAGSDDVDSLGRGTASAVGGLWSTNTTLTNFTDASLLEGTSDNCDGRRDSPLWPAVFFCAVNVLVGIGTSAHYIVGLAYLDNNASKNKSPILLAATSCVQMFGATLGYAVSAFALSIYVDPTLSPDIAKNDPRWIGAWWIGWPLMAALTLAVGCLIALFPRQLPRTRQRQRRLRHEAATAVAPEEGASKLSVQDMKSAIWRLLTNKVLVFNTCSTMCLMYGYASYWTFYPKYIEVQFQKPAGEANVITGSVNLIFTGTGILAAAVFITRFKPHPRKIAAWNVLTEMADMLGHFSWAFLGCSTQDVFDTADSSGIFTSSCNTTIVCGTNPQIQPICSPETNTTFYSPCFAGCNVFNNETKMFGDCACTPNGIAESGLCKVDCSSQFMTFIILKCVLNFLQASGHSGNTLLAFRCVDDKDKSLSIALTQIALSVIVFFPSPTIYGAILDSTCLFWNKSCAGVGNCLLYDKEKMRYLINFIATGFLFFGVAFDIAVWTHSSELKIYEADDSKDINSCSRERSSDIEMENDGLG